MEVWLHPSEVIPSLGMAEPTLSCLIRWIKQTGGAGLIQHTPLTGFTQRRFNVGILKESLEEIVSVINAGSYSQSFTAVKDYRPAFDNADRDLTVSCWPDGYERVVDTRDRLARSDYSISVLVRKGVTVNKGTANTTDMDDVLDTVDDIINQIKGNVSKIVSITANGAYDGGRLYNDSDFAVIMTVNLRTMT
jgi:hypothetical protein